MSQPDQLGVRALKLLAEDWMVPVIRGLAGGVVRPAKLERALPRAGHSAVGRRLRRLLASGLVSHEHRPGLPPRSPRAAIPREARYHLTRAGRTLLEVADEAERWESRWCSQAERDGPPGRLAISLSADPHMRAITLLLADGPLRARDIDRRNRDLCRSALHRRLRELVLAGMLERNRRGGVPRYELTPGARHLARVALLAGRWEWHWSRPKDAAPASDLGDLLRMLAPVARVGAPVAGVCRLRLDTGRAVTPDIYLAACAGSVLALARAPATQPQAVAHATPQAWCDALLQREGPIAVSGNRALLAAVIAAFSAALVA
ncbi:MAG: HxlR-like helix-turn-helix [Solirubrobacterales bacterium]|jgi:DNA-binding HxlR family transcriptional regulator|nr:HxlR-like helix-turn-helix [Solirubrobacterales bacterium]